MFFRLVLCCRVWICPDCKKKKKEGESVEAGEEATFSGEGPHDDTRTNRRSPLQAEEEEAKRARKRGSGRGRGRGRGRGAVIPRMGGKKRGRKDEGEDEDESRAAAEEEMKEVREWRIQSFIVRSDRFGLLAGPRARPPRHGA